MGPSIYKLLWMLTSSAVVVASGFSSPLNSKLLSLVPPGAEVVAGFDNHPTGHKAGRLLLTTHFDTLDLDDWQALAGVDSKRIVDEVIEVATCSSAGGLTEHLLLVGGRFDTERIFKAAELNGAERSRYEDETIMLIKPFEREKTQMPETRWLVILNNRIAMLGTQLMVQHALQRYATHADVDMPLMERLSQLRSDVTSWNVLVGSPNAERSLKFTQPNTALTRLIEGAEVLMIGTSFGSKVRVDFSLHAGSDRETAFFTEKAESFADVFEKEPSLQSGSPQPSQRRLGNLSIKTNRLQGSVELSEKEFQEWGQRGGFMRSLQRQVSRAPGRGE